MMDLDSPKLVRSQRSDYSTGGPSVSVLEEDAFRRQRLLPALWRLSDGQRDFFDHLLAAHYEEVPDDRTAAQYFLRTASFMELEVVTKILENLAPEEATVNG